MKNVLHIENLSPRTLLSDKEVQTVYRLNAGTLRNWRLVGRGPKWVRCGRSVRYSVAAIEEFLAAGAATND